ncbi:Cyclin-U4-1, partial [Diplonema papillatum]
MLWCSAWIAAAVVSAAPHSSTKDCSDWGPPINSQDYPKWPYCNRWPGSTTKYMYMEDNIPPMDKPAYKCKEGVLRHDSEGIVCVNYSLGDFYAGECYDVQCCVADTCRLYTCKQKGYTLRAGAMHTDCNFGCTDQTCCTPPDAVPRYNAQGLMFVDEDPARFSFGGTLHLIRALDETDIVGYKIYWAFSLAKRQAPACFGERPLSWNFEKWYDDTKLLAEVKANGFDHDIKIPLKTLPPERCTITLDLKEHSTSATDPCNPHFWIVVSYNDNGAVDVLGSNSDQVGPRYPIKDYESKYELPCAESGITFGNELPQADDIDLGIRNGVESARDCHKLCQEYKGDPPCQFWTWTLPIGGPDEKRCWMETSMMMQRHYTVRVVGPRVCPTLVDGTPNGRERRRCTRWKRFPNRAPFESESGRPAWSHQTRAAVAYPQKPDRPLGPYNYAEACHAICDMDPICIGIVWMKLDPSDEYFHKCFLVQTQKAAVLKDFIAYDSWMCSRANMAPLLNGYTLQQHNFGYKVCTSSALSLTASPNVDCCAASCDGTTGCKAFTYWNADRTCELFASCDKQETISNVTGCALASCYDEYGAATYTKDPEEEYHIVDRFPDTGVTDKGVMVAVQTTPGLEGAQITCAMSRSGTAIPRSPSPPSTAEEMLNLNSTMRATATIVDEHTTMFLKFEAWPDDSGKPILISLGQYYETTCTVHNASSYGVPASVSATTRTRPLPNYDYVGLGLCKSPAADKCDQKGQALPGTTFDACREACDEKEVCTAFWYSWTNSWCHIKISNCSYTQRSTGDNVQCFRRTSYGAMTGKDYFGPGNDHCEKQGGITCAFTRQFGSYERNYYIPPRHNFLSPSTCPAPNDSGAPETARPTTSIPDSSAPLTSVPDTSSPDTMPPTASPDTSSPDTMPPTASPDTSSPDTMPP